METVSLRRPAKENAVNQPRCPLDRCVMWIQAARSSEWDAAGATGNAGCSGWEQSHLPPSVLHPSCEPRPLRSAFPLGIWCQRTSFSINYPMLGWALNSLACKSSLWSVFLQLSKCFPFVRHHLGLSVNIWGVEVHCYESAETFHSGT